MLTFKYQGGARSDEYGAGTGTTSRASTSFSVDCDITCENNRIATIPRRTLNPIYSVENSSCGAITSVDVIDTFNIAVSGLFEELHKNGLDRFGLVNDGFGTNLDATNRLRVDVVFFEQRRDRWWEIFLSVERSRPNNGMNWNEVIPVARCSEALKAP